MPAARAASTTSLGRPLLAQRLVEVAREVGADAIAHGCTAKGNDQVRFEVTAGALAPELQVVAPLREWELLTAASSRAMAAADIDEEIDRRATKIAALEVLAFGRTFIIFSFIH